MPDITMCKGGQCQLKTSCYRYLAKPTPKRQAYFSQIPGQDEECEYYWRVEGEGE
jgi:hypothetical protein